MDDRRFDQLVRSMAGDVSRRGLVRVLVGSLTGMALATRGDAASAKPDRRPCREAGKRCGVGSLEEERCCSGVCCGRACCGEGEACAGVECCPLIRACGDLCCPPESTGCTVDDLPGGPVFGCLCPEGTFYDRERNECGCPDTCDSDHDCCSGKCCQGVCCAQGEDRCCAGVCATQETCICPPGTACSHMVHCHSYGDAVSGQCCSFPQRSFCCADSYPGAGDGVAGCCTNGVDCPQDGRCPEGVPSASGLIIGCCLEGEDHLPECGPDGDCCFHDFVDDDQNTGSLECILPGRPCHPDWPCCSGRCDGGVCTCTEAGGACNQNAACCSGDCDIKGEVCI